MNLCCQSLNRWFLNTWCQGMYSLMSLRGKGKQGNRTPIRKLLVKVQLQRGKWKLLANMEFGIIWGFALSIPGVLTHITTSVQTSDGSLPQEGPEWGAVADNPVCKACRVTGAGSGSRAYPWLPSEDYKRQGSWRALLLKSWPGIFPSFLKEKK